MHHERITKMVSMEKSLIQTIEQIAQKERRSFTQQAKILLENALRRQYGIMPKDHPVPVAQEAFRGLAGMESHPKSAKKQGGTMG